MICLPWYKDTVKSIRNKFLHLDRKKRKTQRRDFITLLLVNARKAILGSLFGIGTKKRKQRKRRRRRQETKTRFVEKQVIFKKWLGIKIRLPSQNLESPRLYQIWELFSTSYNRVGRNALPKKMKLMKRTYRKKEEEEKTREVADLEIY